MENMATVIILLTVVTALAEITDKIKIPYPILLVLAGIGIGLFPGLAASSLYIPMLSFWFFFRQYYMPLPGPLHGLILKKPNDPLRCLRLAASSSRRAQLLG